MTTGLRAGWALSVGSLPHTDPRAAARLVLAATTELPAAPQLVARGEGMLVQLAPWMDGVAGTADGGLAVTGRPGPVGGGRGPDTPGWAGLGALLELAGPGAGWRPSWLKVQLAGPVTVAAALVRAGVPAGTALPVTTAAVSAAVGDVVGWCRAASPAPGRQVLVCIDEPALATGAADGWDVGQRRAALQAVLDAAGEAADATGLHCCGRADWDLVAGLRPDLVSLPATAVDPEADAPALARLLGAGSWLAWGVAGPRARLIGLWDRLARAGCDAGLLAGRALVSPECGLAGLDEAAAAAALTAAAELGRTLSAARREPAA
ncbi:MAG TPA: hypothetical protein VFH45_02750 [Acidimicrobiales bacterium]|nr:hypothetical protein [Acidimicrobiales bacterium]